MKKTYKIDVDCANCANKMEDAAKKTEGVKDAVVNFMTLKMKVEFEENADVSSVMEQVLKNCKKVESDCEIFFQVALIRSHQRYDDFFCAVLIDEEKYSFER